MGFSHFLAKKAIEPKPTFDIVVVGGGAAGLATATHGQSEGLDVVVLDRASRLGGSHARDSWAIENYMGFPNGITGPKLFNTFAVQAGKFGTKMIPNAVAKKLNKTGDGVYVVTLEDGRQVRGKNIVIATGLDHTFIPILDKYINTNVFYGTPHQITKSIHGQVGLVGGGNSSAQAACHMATQKGVMVNMFVRSTLKNSCSSYLITRIRKSKNIRVFEGCTITDVEGEGKLDTVTLSNGQKLHLDSLFVHAGQKPRTAWLHGAVDLDEDGFIKTGKDVKSDSPLETSLEGVFAAGDVRSESTKRIQAASGEGAAALQAIHAYRADHPEIIQSKFFAPPPSQVERMIPMRPVQKNPCQYAWQRAADGTRCGDRATSYPGKKVIHKESLESFLQRITE